jgi:hypothetical protein
MEHSPTAGKNENGVAVTGVLLESAFPKSTDSSLGPTDV